MMGAYEYRVDMTTLGRGTWVLSDGVDHSSQPVGKRTRNLGWFFRGGAGAGFDGLALE